MYAKLFFDKADRALLRMVNEALDKSTGAEFKAFNPNLHPHGILELATTHEFRVAHAVINLLGSIEIGQVEDRLAALRALHDEVLHSAQTPFRYNTGRVLIQIMKEIVRARDDEYLQLKLMHDFRKAAAGNPRIVRQFLARHHLLEMPEEWNQLTTDHHVHDANTKGRKNPTHLIMDAWIKGIRYLAVVYYNYVDSGVARELLNAADIMGITVRIGLEFSAEFRGRFVNFVWAPRGFSDTEAFLAFMDEKPTRALMDEGRKASAWAAQQVFITLNRWNEEHRQELEEELHISLPPITQDMFRNYVRTGQASILHLAEIIHKTLLPLFVEHVLALRHEQRDANCTPERREVIDRLIRRMDTLTPEIILERWFTPELNPELACLDMPCSGANMPELMRLPPPVLLDWLTALRSGYRTTLQLADLTPEDVLELLWDGQGMITHLEMFNLKEWQQGRLSHLEAISALQRAINEGSALHLKQSIQQMIHTMERSGKPQDSERAEKFRVILRNIPVLQAPYKIVPLRSRVGTDSTSNSNIRHGMGLAVQETLPERARRSLAKNVNFRPLTLPVHIELVQRQTWKERTSGTRMQIAMRTCMRKIPGLGRFGMRTRKEWLASVVSVQKNKGNLITMGGIGGTLDNDLLRLNVDTPNQPRQRSKYPGMAYLNTPISNIIKVLAGFIPALATFLVTQEWWVLAWFGAPIWFAITGFRNVLQAIFAGGGLRASSLLRWNNLVNWTRICDSLLYTGISVLLLEWLIRVVLLEESLGLTVVDHSIVVFSIIAAANGLYIAWHNAFRGFPRAAVIGNMFRSVLAIPMSVLYYEILYVGLSSMGMPDPSLVLQPGAAIISKTASDTVAALIEGVADRRNNRRLREWDYTTKLAHMFNCYTALDLAFPDRNLLKMLDSKTEDFIRLVEQRHKPLLQAFIINALDMMYFWMYQPYAQQTLQWLVRSMTPDEKRLLIGSQRVLSQVRDVSQLFVDGLVGAQFAKALSFYLSGHDQYIERIEMCCEKRKSTGAGVVLQPLAATEASDHDEAETSKSWSSAE